MLDKRLLLDQLLLDGDGVLLFDLGLDHFDEVLLSSLVESRRRRGRLCLRLLPHQLLILNRELLDLGLILFDLCGLPTDGRGQAGEHGAQLQAILGEFTFFIGQGCGNLLLDAHSAVVLHREVCHKAAINVRMGTWISLLLLR